jgi:hypothetical protein
MSASNVSTRTSESPQPVVVGAQLASTKVSRPAPPV